MGRKTKSTKITPVRGVTITPDNTYQIAFTYRGELCRERYNFEISDANTNWVNRRKQDIDTAIKQGTFHYETFFPDSKNVLKYASNPAALVTVRDYYDNWLLKEGKHLKHSGLKTQKSIIENQFYPTFGEMKLNELTPDLIHDWLMNMDVSHKTKKNRLTAIRAPLSDADKKLLPVNPLTGFVLKKTREDKVREREMKKDEPVQAFDHVERKALLKVLSGQYLNFVEFNMWTGLRPSEMIGLLWEDVDFVNKRIEVKRCRTECTPAGETELTKTIAGERLVPLTTPAYNALLRQKEHTFLAGKEVFTKPGTGTGWRSPSDVNKTFWKSALKKAGLPFRDQYTLRHTFASIMLMGAKTTQDEELISKAMGHTDVAFTRRTYYTYLHRDDSGNIFEEIAQEWEGKDDRKSL